MSPQKINVQFVCGHLKEREFGVKKNGEKWTGKDIDWFLEKAAREGLCGPCWSAEQCSKYEAPEVTINFVCGHDGTVILDVKKNGEPWTAAGRKWYVEDRTEERDCLECWRAANPVAPRIDLDEAETKMQWGEIEMVGSEKQIIAARLIRVEMFVEMSETGSLDFLELSPDFENAATLAGEADDSHWWLENKEALQATENFEDLGFLIATGIDSGEAVTCENPV